MNATLLKCLHLVRIAGLIFVLVFPSARYFLAPPKPSLMETKLPAWSWQRDFLRTAPELYTAFVDRHFLYGDRWGLITPPKPKYHFVAPNLSISVADDQEHPKRIFSTNSEGIRGPDFSSDKTYRILCVGDSVTQCSYLDDADAMTSVLMMEMNRRSPSKPAWAGGAGIAGYLSSHHLEYLKTDPLVTRYTHLVFLFGINDLFAWIGKEVREPRSDVPAPASRGTPPPILRAGIKYGLLAHVRINLGAVPEIDERANPVLIDHYPSPDVFLHSYRARIIEIISMCKSLNIQPVFATQPVLWAKDLPESAEHRIWAGETAIPGRFLSTPSLRQLADMINAVSMDACREQGVPIADLSFMNGEPELFLDDCHFSQAGARVAGEAIAKTVLAVGQ